MFVARLIDHYHLWLIIFGPIVFWNLLKFVSGILKAMVQALIK